MNNHLVLQLSLGHLIYLMMYFIDNFSLFSIINVFDPYGFGSSGQIALKVALKILRLLFIFIVLNADERPCIIIILEA